mmetsp:Transcript_55673/g.143446  ORF Transcript_55673/g.143446 Transcript_55673/m.143446 type:complete len:113 (+) Transcript_55673:81-419(+)|eukprot:CAMPEP_0195058438 /NCGR_PEP_ID=MMETSP0448-20130528/6290_1 /TAXON_ID=66468 /ORGANISM="Heterocapsa triquestra, Strain CCMP 448" /LENGTH=112 /DNA_ID=CAMNT_0040088589 /DNA_START=60 /DNA_END=398 /DNA_ORIENTATION=-
MPAGTQLSRRSGKKGPSGAQAELIQAMAADAPTATSDLDVAALEREAKKGLDKMSNPDRVALVDKMSKRVDILMGLPAEARIKHMTKLSHEERVELMSAQILIGTIRQHMAA